MEITSQFSTVTLPNFPELSVSEMQQLLSIVSLIRKAREVKLY
jgi:hypothetical protein